MNGIHEVTGSIPVWSTILRSPHFAERASDGKPTFALDRGEGTPYRASLSKGTREGCPP
jgi:hypothetical protein